MRRAIALIVVALLAPGTAVLTAPEVSAAAPPGFVLPAELPLGPARDANYGRETTSSMAARSGAVAAVNGGFFTIDGTRDIPGPWLEGTDGDPAGIAVVEGELLSEAVNDRPALVLAREDGRAAIRRLATELQLIGPRGDRQEITGVNRERR
jgi:hypothetical protein